MPGSWKVNDILIRNGGAWNLLFDILFETFIQIFKDSLSLKFRKMLRRLILFEFHIVAEIVIYLILDDDDLLKSFVDIDFGSQLDEFNIAWNLDRVIGNKELIFRLSSIDYIKSEITNKDIQVFSGDGSSLSDEQAWKGTLSDIVNYSVKLPDSDFVHMTILMISINFIEFK